MMPDRLENVEWGALLLFSTNLGAILVFGALVFLLQGYGKFRVTGIGFFAPLALIIVLAFPLAKKFHQQSARSQIAQVLRELSRSHPDWNEARLNRLRVEDKGEFIKVRMRLEAPVGVIDFRDSEVMREALNKHFGRPVEVEIYRMEYELVVADEASSGE